MLEWHNSDAIRWRKSDTRMAQNWRWKWNDATMRKQWQKSDMFELSFRKLVKGYQSKTNRISIRPMKSCQVRLKSDQISVALRRNSRSPRFICRNRKIYHSLIGLIWGGEWLVQSNFLRVRSDSYLIKQSFSNAIVSFFWESENVRREPDRTWKWLKSNSHLYFKLVKLFLNCFNTSSGVRRSSNGSNRSPTALKRGENRRRTPARPRWTT